MEIARFRIEDMKSKPPQCRTKYQRDAFAEQNRGLLMNAGKMIREVIEPEGGTAGGHGSMAGARLPVTGTTPAARRLDLAVAGQYRWIAAGAALGTVLAFMMAVIGLSLPEAIILRKVLTLKLIFVFFGVVAFGILIVGYVFNTVM